MCIYTHINIYICTYIYTYTYRHYASSGLYIYVYIYIYACTYVCMYMCMYVYIYVYTYMYMHICFIFASSSVFFLLCSHFGSSHSGVAQERDRDRDRNPERCSDVRAQVVRERLFVNILNGAVREHSCWLGWPGLGRGWEGWMRER